MILNNIAKTVVLSKLYKIFTYLPKFSFATILNYMYIEKGNKYIVPFDIGDIE